MGVNLLYNGTDQGAPDLCSADSVQMKKEIIMVHGVGDFGVLVLATETHILLLS